MIEASIIPEIGIGALSLGLLAFAVITQKQREWVLKRDKHECQVKGFKGITCDPKHLEVDHIIPQRWGREMYKMSEQELDTPLNLLTLCRNHHRGHPQSKHPDAHEAWWNYQDNKNGFNEIFVDRAKQCELNDPYWNEEYDAIESAMSVRNTTIYQRQHPEDKFPPKNGKNGKNH